MNSTDADILTNFYVSASRPDNMFEEKYLYTRRKENRVYRDEEVMSLPDIWKSHPHYKEWMIRKKSSQRLLEYFKAKNCKLDVLEIGCGNGWLSYHMARIPNCEVIGSDINLTELQQAVRVFARKSRLKFIYGDIRSGMLNDLEFDAIVFAASIQYFPSLMEIMNVSLSRLKPGGEIHILDSPLYSASKIDAARERSKAYYNSMGMPEMTRFYFHHPVSALASFHHKILSNPGSIRNRIFGKNPFPWIIVKNQ